MGDVSLKTLEAKHVDDTERFIDAAIQNPDNDRRGGIPDLVNGPSFTRSQTISTKIDGSAVVATTYDVYVVQWDFETLTQCVGRYYIRSTDPLYPNFYHNVSTFAIETGSLMAYVMEPGFSPFPSNNPAVVGPSAPVAVFPLRFTDSLLSGNTRVVGSDFQVKYAGPELSAQGIWTQSSYSSYKTEETNYFNAGPVPANAYNWSKYTETKEMMPGDPSSMVKYPGSVQRPAYDGVLQSAIVNYHNNYPSLPANKYKKYKGIVPSGSVNAYDLFVGQMEAPAGGVIYNAPPMWDSNCEIHFAVCTGIPKDHPLQLIRRLTVETFPNPNDALIAFAHPSPLADMSLLADVMNAFRTEQRFWASRDNALGNFSRALRKGVKKTMKVGKAGLGVAAAFNPQAAAALEAAKTVKALSKGKSTVDQNARDIQKLSSMIGQMKVSGENGRSSTGNLSLAAPKRKRTKPARG